MIILLLLVFIVGPILVLVAIARDITSSRRIGREIDLLALSLLLHLEDISDSSQSLNPWKVKANLQDTLDQVMQQVSTKWIIETTTFLSAVTEIAFGEVVRKPLMSNPEKQRRIFSYAVRLARSIEAADFDLVLERTGDLLATTLCVTDRGDVASQLTSEQLISRVEVVLKDGSELLVRNELPAVDIKLTTTLQEIATNCNLDKIGVLIVVLKWAHRDLLFLPNHVGVKNTSHIESNKKLAEDYVSMANAVRLWDLSGIARLVYRLG